MWRSLSWTIRNPSSDSGQRSILTSTRSTRGMASAARTPTAVAAATTPTTPTARIRAAPSAGPAPSSQSRPSVIPSITTVSSKTPIQSSGIQESQRSAGGR